MPRQNPWLSIPLADYEGHMNAPAVHQLAALSSLFKYALEHVRPESVAIVGIAGGNGLDHIDSSITKRVVGIDINQDYLDETRRRFRDLPGLELHCADLANGAIQASPVALVHAALLFEHTGLECALENALALVKPLGTFSAVLQTSSPSASNVASSPYASIQLLARDFALINVQEFQTTLESRGFELMKQVLCQVASGKELWHGIFEARH